MELPPEQLELFLSHDIRVADSGAQCALETDSGKPGAIAHVVEQGSAHRIIVSIAQENKNFRVCDVGRAFVGNVRAQGSAASLDTSWTALPVAKQSRSTGDESQAAWVVECDMPFLPQYLQGAEAVGGVFDVDVKLDVNEIERIGALEDPMTTSKTITLKIVAAGEGGAIKAAEPEVIRRRRLTSVAPPEPLYLGQFEVTDNAVNEAMQTLRDTGEPSDSAKEVLAEHDQQVAARKMQLVNDALRQSEELALRAEEFGLVDLAAALEMWQLPSEVQTRRTHAPWHVLPTCARPARMRHAICKGVHVDLHASVLPQPAASRR